TVLRDGRRVATTRVADVDRAQLIRWMVGRDLADEFPARDAQPGGPLLDVHGLSAPPYFQDVSLSVRRGEIVGLAGLVGAGRTSVGLWLFGGSCSGGDVQLDGHPLRARRPRQAMAQRAAYVTQDRAP